MQTIVGLKGEVYHGYVQEWCGTNSFYFDAIGFRHIWCDLNYWRFAEIEVGIIKVEQLNDVEEEGSDSWWSRMISSLVGWKPEMGEAEKQKRRQDYEDCKEDFD